MTGRRVSSSTVAILVPALLVLHSAASASDFGGIPGNVQAQALRAARAEQHRDLRFRRPPGLEDVDSEASMRRAAEENVALLSSEDSAVVDAATVRLRYLGGHALDALAEGLFSEDLKTSGRCARLLGWRGSAAVPLLLARLQDDPEEQLHGAIMGALGQTYHPDAVPAVITGLSETSFFGRLDTIRALENLHDPRALEPLRNLLNDPGVDGQLRCAAAQALFGIDKEWGSDAVRSAMETAYSESDRHNLGVVLERQLDFGWWPPALLEVCQLARDASTIDGERFGRKAIGVLLKHAGSEYPKVSSECLLALGNLKAKSAVPGIIRQASGYGALAAIGSPDAVRCLLAGLESPEKEIRESVIIVLGQNGGRWAAPVLIAMLDDSTLRIACEQVDSFVPWPERHLALEGLYSCLGNAGLPGRHFNLAGEHPWRDIDDEIARVKAWWERYGNDFLGGRPVENPNLVSYFYAT